MLSVETLDERTTKENDSNVAVRGTVPIGEMTQALVEARIECPQSPKAPSPKARSKPKVLRIKGKDTAEAEASNVSCFCGDQSNDLGMIQCDECKYWEHTVCAGFYSNTDKRLESFTKRVCYRCYFNANPAHSEVLKFVTLLCRIRRALSIIYGEGFDNKNALRVRLGISGKGIAVVANRLLSEGFLVNDPSAKNNCKLSVCKTLEAKARIKAYFNTNLESFEEFCNLKRRFPKQARIKNSPSTDEGVSQKQPLPGTPTAKRRKHSCTGFLPCLNESVAPLR